MEPHSPTVLSSFRFGAPAEDTRSTSIASKDRRRSTIYTPASDSDKDKEKEKEKEPAVETRRRRTSVKKSVAIDVSELVKQLQASKDSTEKISELCATLADATNNNQNTSKMAAEAKLAPLLAALITDHQRDETVVTPASRVLMNMCVYKECRDKIDENVIKALLQVVKLHAVKGSLELQESATKVLQQMCINNEANQQLIADEGGVQHMMDAIRAHAKDPALQRLYYSVLYQVSHDEENRQQIVADGGLKCILSSLRAHGKEPTLIHECANLLVNLTSTDKHCKKFLEAKGVEVLLDVMQDNAADHPMQGGCCQVLNNLVMCEFLLPKLADIGILKAVMELLQDLPPEKTAVAEKAASVLDAFLPSSNTKNSESSKTTKDDFFLDFLSTDEELALIVRTMHVHLGNNDVANVMCKILEQLSANAECLEFLRTQKVLPTLVELSARHLPMQELQLHICEIFANFSEKAKSITDMVTGGSVDCVLNLMEQHRAESEIQELACFLLGNIASACKGDLAKKLPTKRLVEGLHAAMGAHADDTAIQFNAAQCLYNTAVTVDDWADSVTTKIADAVFAAFKLLAKDKAGEEVCCKILLNLGTLNDTIKSHLIKLGLATELKLCINRHHKEDVVKGKPSGALLNSCKILANLIHGEEEVAETARNELGSDICEYLITALGTFKGQFKFHACCCMAIGNMAISSRFRSTLVEKGAIDAVLAAFQAGKSDESLTGIAGWPLAVLALKQESTRPELLKKNALDVVQTAAAYKGFVLDEEQQKMCVEAADILVGKSPPTKDTPKPPEKPKQKPLPDHPPTTELAQPAQPAQAVPPAVAPLANNKDAEALKSAQDECHQLREKLKSTEQKCEQLRAETKQAKEETKRAKAELDTVQLELQQLQALAQSTDEKQKAEAAKRETEQLDLQRSEAQCQKLTAEIEQLKQAHLEEIGTLVGKTKELTTEREQLERRLQELSSELEAAKAESAATETQAAQRADPDTTQMASMARELEAVRVQLATAEKQAKESAEAAEKAKGETLELQQQLQTIRSEMAQEMERLLAEADKKIEGLKAEQTLAQQQKLAEVLPAGRSKKRSWQPKRQMRELEKCLLALHDKDSEAHDEHASEMLQHLHELENTLAEREKHLLQRENAAAQQEEATAQMTQALVAAEEALFNIQSQTQRAVEERHRLEAQEQELKAKVADLDTRTSESTTESAHSLELQVLRARLLEQECLLREREELHQITLEEIKLKEQAIANREEELRATERALQKQEAELLRKPVPRQPSETELTRFEEMSRAVADKEQFLSAKLTEVTAAHGELLQRIQLANKEREFLEDREQKISEREKLVEVHDRNVERRQRELLRAERILEEQQRIVLAQRREVEKSSFELAVQTETARQSMTSPTANGKESLPLSAAVLKHYQRQLRKEEKKKRRLTGDPPMSHAARLAAEVVKSRQATLEGTAEPDAVALSALTVAIEDLPAPSSPVEPVTTSQSEIAHEESEELGNATAPRRASSPETASPERSSSSRLRRPGSVAIPQRNWESASFAAEGPKPRKATIALQPTPPARNVLQRGSLSPYLDPAQRRLSRAVTPVTSSRNPRNSRIMQTAPQVPPEQVNTSGVPSPSQPELWQNLFAQVFQRTYAELADTLAQVPVGELWRGAEVGKQRLLESTGQNTVWEWMNQPRPAP